MKIYIFVFLCLQIGLHCLALPTLSQLQAEIDELKAIHNEQSEKTANTVGFTAFLNDDIDVAEGARIPFSRVQFNEGDAYSGTNAEFTCTVTGVYSFFASAMTSDNTGTALIVRNDGSTEHHLASIFNANSHWDHSANSALTRCNAGDKVYVKNADHAGTVYRATREPETQQSYYTTSFSGFLVALD